MRRDLVNKSGSLAGTSDLTVFAPIKPGLVPALEAMTYKTRVKRVLRTLHLGRTGSHENELVRLLSDSVERVGRIHSVSMAVIEGQNKAPDQVMLTVTFDGAWEAYVRVIWQKVARLLDLVFCNTQNYVIGWENSYEAWGTWLRDAQAETAFLYATPGLTVDDTRYLRMHERLHRRDGRANASGSASADADLALTRLRIPSAEDIAEQSLFGTAGTTSTIGTDPTNAGFGVPLTVIEAGAPAFRHGVRSLVGLYRLADAFLPGTPDGQVLHRAAQELLPEFVRMLQDGNTYQLGVSRTTARFDEAMHWLTNQPAAPAVRVPPPLPARQPLAHPDNVQGGIVTPYQNVDHGGLLLLGFDTPAALAAFLAAVKVSTEADAPDSGSITTNLAFTAQGLRLAGLSEDEVREFPAEFVQGMESRAGLLGDLRINHPRRWRLPARNWALGAAAPNLPEGAPEARVDFSAVHAVLHLQWRRTGGSAAVNAPSARAQLMQRMTECVQAHDGIQPLSLQWMERRRDGSGNVVEHFGFRDGGSDPVLDAPPPGSRFPNQVHLGEILCGHPNRADHIDAGQARQDRVKVWLQDGSFLVVRKLRQDIGALKTALQGAASTGLGRDTLMAKMMGRWPASHADAGKPLAKPVDAPTDGSLPNDFNYDADPHAAVCPFHAHIRRVNPRETRPEPGSRPPRIVRRGMSYGPAHDNALTGDAEAKSLAEERGLVFMAYNASIGEQFEVVQRWLTGGNSSGAYAGQSDPLLGLAEPGRQRFFAFEHAGRTTRMALDGSDDLSEPPRPFVRLEWGAYLFAPSIAALTALAARAGEARVQVAWRADRGEREIERLRAVEAHCGDAAAVAAWKAALEDPEAATDFTSASIWAAIRQNHGGVLRTVFGVLVASKPLVDSVLRDAEGRLSVAGYWPRMQRSFGGIYLGLDAGRPDAAYEHESEACNRAIMGLDADQAFTLARDATRDAMHLRIVETVTQATQDGDPRWDLTLDARELVNPLLAKLCEAWFGLSEDGGFFRQGGFRWDWRPGDPPNYPGHFLAPSRYFFQPRPNAEVAAFGADHGVALRQAMAQFLARSGATITAPVTRAVLDTELARRDADFAPRTVAGAVMGFVPTVDGNLRRILNEWLRDGTLWALRGRFAGQPAAANYADAFARLGEPFVTAMQLRAAPELLWRTATVAHTLGGDATTRVNVRPGDIVVASLVSATQQSLEEGQADLSHAFGGNRWPTGSAKERSPTHACPGQYAAMAAMLGFFSALVESPEPLRAGPGPLTLALDGPVAPEKVAFVRRVHLHWRQQQVAINNPEPDVTGAPAPLMLLGDSWMTAWWEASFVGALRRFGYDPIQRFSSLGARLADLAQPAKLVTICAWLRNIDPADPQRPRAIFMGGGGNDVVCPTSEPMRTPLYRMLKTGATGSAALIVDEAQRFIDVELFAHCKTIIDALIDANRGETAVPIFVHSYDHPIPDGRADLPEQPWLKPVFTARGIDDNTAAAVMAGLIDRLAAMVTRLAADHPKRVFPVDLRGSLAADPRSATDPKPLWRNELHPTEAGFQVLAGVVARCLREQGVHPG